MTIVVRLHAWIDGRRGRCWAWKLLSFGLCKTKHAEHQSKLCPEHRKFGYWCQFAFQLVTLLLALQGVYSFWTDRHLKEVQKQIVISQDVERSFDAAVPAATAMMYSQNLQMASYGAKGTYPAELLETINAARVACKAVEEKCADGTMSLLDLESALVEIRSLSDKADPYIAKEKVESQVAWITKWLNDIDDAVTAALLGIGLERSAAPSAFVEQYIDAKKTVEACRDTFDSAVSSSDQRHALISVGNGLVTLVSASRQLVVESCRYREAMIRAEE